MTICTTQIHIRYFSFQTFPLCSASRHLYSALIGERLCVELVQLYQMGPKILASFNTDVNDIVFESPEIIRGKQIRTEQHTMIMHTTHHFPVKIWLRRFRCLRANVRMSTLGNCQPIRECNDYSTTRQNQRLFS